MFWGQKLGKFAPPPWAKWLPKEHIHLHRNTFLGAISEKHASNWALLCIRWRNQKMKARDGTNSSTSSPHPRMRRPPYFACGIGRWTLIKHGKYQVNRFRGFGAPLGRQWPSSIDLAPVLFQLWFFSFSFSYSCDLSVTVSVTVM